MKKNENHKTELDLLKEISEKLDQLISLNLIQGKEKEDQIRVLVERGISNSNIANILSIPKGTVDVIRAKQKKEKIIRV
jgi:hypothetical protein